MATEFVRQQPLVSGFGGSRVLGAINSASRKLLSKKKYWIGTLGGAAIVAAAALYFWGNQTSAAQYLSARVERGNLRNTVTATGTLQAVTTVQVGSQASGTISSLTADYNSVVKKGQVIAQLEPSVAKAQVDQARANLLQAQASLQQARAAVRIRGRRSAQGEPRARDPCPKFRRG